VYIHYIFFIHSSINEHFLDTQLQGWGSKHCVLGKASSTEKKKKKKKKRKKENSVLQILYLYLKQICQALSLSLSLSLSVCVCSVVECMLKALGLIPTTKTKIQTPPPATSKQ
jgi:hypothetical protein